MAVGCSTGSSHTLAQASGACALRHFHTALRAVTARIQSLHRSQGSMTRSHPKGPASWVMSGPIAFAGLCIFGASLVIHEPLEKIANCESYTVVFHDKSFESLKIAPLRVRSNTRN